MKVCVPLRDPAGTDLRSDNFRSEPRWERLAIEAAIENPEVSEIYIAGCRWSGGSEITSKYKGQISPNKARECVLLMQDWNNSIINMMPFKAAVVNIFHGPWLEQKDEIWEITKKLNNNLFFTMGHPTIYIDELTYPDLFDNKLLFPTDAETAAEFVKMIPGGIHSLTDRVRKSPLSHMRNFTSMDRFFFLPVPWVPKSQYEDRFNNKRLLWSCRLISMRQMAANWEIEWAFKRMMDDPSLYLDALTGFKPEEARIIDDAGTAIPLKEDINEYFWKIERFKPYISLRDRVKVHYGMSWADVLKMNAAAKLFILYAKQYGGPPLEAAMYGVPFIGCSAKTGALVDCPDYLVASSEEEGRGMLDRLMDDHEFYTKTALSYNKYVVDTYSFASFNTTLNDILGTRGLL